MVPVGFYQDARDQTMSCPNETTTFTQSILITDPGRLADLGGTPCMGLTGIEYTVSQTFQGGHQITGMVELFFYYSPTAIEVSCDIKPGTSDQYHQLEKQRRDSGRYPHDQR